MKILRDQVIVRPDEPDAEPKTDSGILLPNGAQNPWAVGEVVALGEYAAVSATGEKDPFPYVVGDRVQYARGAGQPFELGADKSIVLVHAPNIYAVLELGVDYKLSQPVAEEAPELSIV